MYEVERWGVTLIAGFIGVNNWEPTLGRAWPSPLQYTCKIFSRLCLSKGEELVGMLTANRAPVLTVGKCLRICSSKPSVAAPRVAAAPPAAATSHARSALHVHCTCSCYCFFNCCILYKHWLIGSWLKRNLSGCRLTWTMSFVSVINLQIFDCT